MANRYAILFLFILTGAQALALDAYYKSISDGFYVGSKMSFGSRRYYSCDQVETKLTELLELMGAKNIEVQCYGGMDRFRAPHTWEISVSLEYSTLRQATENSIENEPYLKAEWQTIRIKTADDCFLLSQVFGLIRKNFEVRSLRAARSCVAANRSFQIQFATLVPL